MASLGSPSRADSVLRKLPHEEKTKQKAKNQLIADFDQITKQKDVPSCDYICLQDLRACWEGHWSQILQLINLEDCIQERISLIKEKMLIILSVLVTIGADHCLSEFGSRFFVEGSAGPKLTDDNLPLEPRQINFFPDEPECVEQFSKKQYKFIPQVIQVFAEAQTQVIYSQLRLPFESIISEYGSGGFSQVDLVTVSRGYFEYIEQDNRLVNFEPTIVACKKIIIPDHFKNESKNLKILKESLTGHSHIVKHYVTIEHGRDRLVLLPYAELGDLYQFMHCGFVDGELRYHFATMFPDIVESALEHEIMRQIWAIADAIAYLHKGFLVESDSKLRRVHCAHMDLKPDNILIFRNRNSSVGMWKISDFGISVIEDTKRKQPADIVSVGEYISMLTLTLNARPARKAGIYSAPEVKAQESSQWRDSDGSREKGIGRSSDIWSFGCILSELLAFSLGRDKLVDEFMRARIQDADSSFFEVNRSRLILPGAREPFRVRESAIKWLDNLCHLYSSPERWIDCWVGTVKEILVVDPQERPDASKLEKLVDHLKQHVQATKYGKPVVCQFLHSRRGIGIWRSPRTGASIGLGYAWSESEKSEPAVEVEENATSHVLKHLEGTWSGDLHYPILNPDEARPPTSATSDWSEIRPPTDSAYMSATHKSPEIEPPTDSAYMSATHESSEYERNLNDLESDEVRTDYSDTPSLPPLREDSYISKFADDLSSKVLSEQPDDQTVERISRILPELLKAFSLKIGHNAGTQMHRDVMFFVHKNRNRIARSFKDQCCVQEETLSDSQALNSDKIPVKDFVGNWIQNLEDPEDEDIGNLKNQNSTEDAVNDSMNPDSDEDEEANVPDLLTYQNFISKAPAYKWLLANLHRECLLFPAEPNIMEALRHQIVHFLPSSHKVSRKRSSETCKMTFEIEWCPLAFIKEQEYREAPYEVAEIAITLTGSAKNAQALTCAQYLCQTWPSVGQNIIQLVKDVVCGGPGHRHKCDLPDRSQLTAWIHGSKFMVEAFGTRYSVAEIGEQFAWLGAALRSSPYGFVSYCTPFISDIRMNDAPAQASEGAGIICKIDFTVHERENHLEPANGQCWYNMFRNPIIVKGYPISRRCAPDTGLEIPINMMAGLTRTRHAHIFNGKLFVKGFSSMLIPTKQCGDLIIWHLLYNNDGKRISYLDNTIPHAENVSISNLEKARHIIGWCSDVKNYAGAADARYSIDRSRLPGPHAGCVLEKISVSGGKFITGGVVFGIGNKDTPVYISRNGYIPKLQWISKKFVVLWDEEDKRGWLVNGISALLHLLRASLEYNMRDKFKSAFLFKSEEMEEASITHRADSAIEVLLNPANMKLPIYPEKGEMYDEETRRKTTSLEEVSKKRMDYLRLEDRVEHFYNILEKIIDCQVDVAGQSGVKLKLRVRKHLEGWDFMDLATDRDPFYPRVATLHIAGKSWVDLTRAIHAITLFGRGFGEIIRPADPTMSCSHWTSLPKGKYYLAACISDVKEIMDLYGDPRANPMKLTDDIIWHSPDKIFELCKCRGRIQRKHSDFAQVLLPSKFHAILPKMDPVSLEDNGAVIFGHNVKFKWYWKDTGDPEQGESPLSAESETQFHDSRISSGLSSSAAGATGHPSGSSSELSPSEASSGIQLPTPATSEATGFNESKPQVSSTQSHENSGPAVSRRGRQDKRSMWRLLHALRKLRGDANAGEDTQS